MTMNDQKNDRLWELLKTAHRERIVPPVPAQFSEGIMRELRTSDTVGQSTWLDVSLERWFALPSCCVAIVMLVVVVVSGDLLDSVAGVTQLYDLEAVSLDLLIW